MPRSGGSSRASSRAARWPARSFPELVKVFTSTESRHVREIVTSSREGGASLNILSGSGGGQLQRLLAGHDDDAPDGDRPIGISTHGLGALMLAPAVFAFGLVAFGFLGMGPVTIAVDSYGPVTDNAQSVYELSLIETFRASRRTCSLNFGFTPEFRARQGEPGRERRRGEHVQGHGEAGADRHGRGRRDDHDLLDHRGADQRAHAESGKAFDSASAVPAGPDGRRRDHLLVHRRVACRR